MIFNMSGSVGGTGGLELKIVGGTTRPAKPTQNTIWVNTDVEITDYILSVVEPEEPVEHMVWITIGNSGSIKACSPVGDDWITVYPLSAKQLIDGVWVSKSAMSYQYGAWVDWVPEGVLYDTGNLCVSNTGGWSADGVSTSGSDSTKTVVPPTFNSDNMVVGLTTAPSQAVWCCAYTNNKIKFTENEKTLCCTYKHLAVDGGKSVALNVKPNRIVYDQVVAEKVFDAPVGTTQTVRIDVSSLTGDYYIAFEGWVGGGGTRAAEIHKIWLE